MVEINNLTTTKIDRKLLQKASKEILKKEGKNNFKLSVAFVGLSEIRKLNKKYRKRNRPTDVLSYTYNNSSGEVVIAPQQVRENAKKFGSTFKKELTRVLIHGILHLLGYDHIKRRVAAKKMAKKEKYYFSKNLKH